MAKITVQGDTFEIAAISPRARRILKTLIETHDVFAFKGSTDPDDWGDIEDDFARAVATFSRFVHSLETRARLAR